MTVTAFAREVATLLKYILAAYGLIIVLTVVHGVLL